MKITLSIPSVGFREGTCGWLAEKLHDQTITIKPGRTSGGIPGLWMHSGEGQECLALFDPWDFPQKREFATFRGFCTDGLKMHPWTPAAEECLASIAQQWCDRENALRENDDPASLESVIVD